MKTISQEFKEQIKELGREFDSVITYELDGETIELRNEDLNSVTPHYNADILKSVMRQLDLDSNVEIPEGTIVNYKLGLKVNGEYEYLNFGNYIVYKIEEQKDLRSYKITCYDKMLYAMKDYENLNVVYPITIRNYINTLCQHIGLTFKNINDNFANYNKEIPYELYLDSEGNTLNYTFRDVLDELAQVTASTICINEEDDQLEIRYINTTSDTIDEEYLKDINVDFGKKYGPVNSIVLSRGQGADNIYMKDDQSIEENGLCEIKISDNQIMNRNDRDTFLNDIFNKLNRLEYYLNDFSSTGVCYYNLCDRYNVTIGEDNYSCVMLNDEILVTQGLQENIHTDIPDQGETDYTKADKTDRKINQTYFIVDKQNQKIESVITNVTSQNDKISQLTQTVDELSSKISDTADITTSGETEEATIDLDNINLSEPITIKIRPNTTSISWLYPRNNLYPSDNLYPTNRIIRFYNKTTEETVDYILPDDLLFINSNVYDEFYLDYDSKTCQITKRCGYNADGSVYQLSQEVITDYEYPTILLNDGDYTVSIPGYDNAYIFVRLMAQNIYTTQFATRVEVNTAINQTAQEINLEVNKKVNEDEIISKINLSSEEAVINANKVSLAGKTINLSSDNVVIDSANFKVDNQGNMTCNNGTFKGNINGSTFTFGDITLTNELNNSYGMLKCKTNSNGSLYGTTDIDGADIVMSGKNKVLMRITTYPIDGDAYMFILGEITARAFNKSSQAEKKKNFEKFDNALSIIKNTDIYKYHYKEQKDDSKKEIGLIIGEKYKYSKELTNNNNEAVNISSMVGVCFQAIKEQQEEIEKLKEEIKSLKEE